MARFFRKILTQPQAPILSHFEHKNELFSKYLKNTSLDFFYIWHNFKNSWGAQTELIVWFVHKSNNFNLYWAYLGVEKSNFCSMCNFLALSQVLFFQFFQFFAWTNLFLNDWDLYKKLVNLTHIRHKKSAKSHFFWIWGHLDIALSVILLSKSQIFTVLVISWKQ